MGTKLQCKNYLPAYYSMRDLNEDANSGSWSQFCDEQMLRSAQYYNGLTQRNVDGYSEYDKEILRQTMLNHEATFRKQVYELHRLYRKQKDMMAELQKKELYSNSMSGETSQSNPFSSRMPSECNQRMWQMPNGPVVNPSCGPSISGTDNRLSPIEFLKESSMQAGVTTTQNVGSSRDYESLDSKCKKFPKRTFDLQLPADEYIDSEDEVGTEEKKAPKVSVGASYSINRPSDIEPKHEVNLSLGADENLNSGAKDWKIDLHTRNTCRTNCLADLNEPIRGICGEEAEASTSFSFLGPMAYHGEIQGQQLPMKPNTSIPVLQKDFFLDNQKGGDQRTFASILHAQNEENRRELISYRHETGQNKNSTNAYTSLFCSEKLPISLEPFQAKVKESYELPPFLSSAQSRRDTWFGEKATCITETSKASPNLNIPKSSGKVSPTASPFSDAPGTSNTSNISPSLSPWRNSANYMNHSPGAIQALACLNGSAAMNMQNGCSNSSMQSPAAVREKWDLHGSSISHHPSASYQNGCNEGFEPRPYASHLQLIDCDRVKHQSGVKSTCDLIEGHAPMKFLNGPHRTDAKSSKGMNLNVCLPDDFEDEVKPLNNHVPTAAEGKHGELAGIPWLRRNLGCNESLSIRRGSTQMDLGFSRGCSQQFSGQDAKIHQFESGTGPTKDPALDFVPRASALFSKDAVTPKSEISDNPSNNKILGFPLFNKTHVSKDTCAFSSSSMPSQDRSEINGTQNNVKIFSSYIDLPSNDSLPELDKKQLFVEHLAPEKGADNSHKSQRHYINLNSTVSAFDEVAESSEISAITDVANPASLVPSAAVEIKTVIDLEAPVTPLVEDDAPPQGEPASINLLETTVQRMHCETVDPQGTFARLAAQLLVDLSSAVHSQSEDANCGASSADLKDTLLWFSEVASSTASDLESMMARGKADGGNESSEDGVDFFEAMTLKLCETKMDLEYFYKPWDWVTQKDEGTSMATLLTRPRRRQARRGRQRKDFQKDILPGLVSLSRHEVAEDFQILGELMKASGGSWQAGVAKRNTGRNGWHGQARGRRRPRGAAACVVTNVAAPPSRQPINGEVEAEGISLRGWGKTTRRCRRQRYPTGNVSAPLT